MFTRPCPTDRSPVRSTTSSRRRRRFATSILLSASLVAAACGDDDGTTDGTTAAPASSAAPSTDPAPTDPPETTAGTEPAETAAPQPEGVRYDGVTVRLAEVGRPGSDAGFFYGDVGASVERYGASAEVAGTFPALGPALEALAADAADIARGSITAVLGAWAGTSDVVVFGYSPDYPSASAIVVPADSDIQTPADLVGKKVAVNKAGSGEYMLDMVMLEYGLEPGSVEKVYLAPADAVSAFASGAVDAWGAFGNQTITAQEQFGGRLLVSTVTDLDVDNDVVLVVRREFAEQYPGLVRGIFEGWAAGWERIAEDPSEYTDLFVREAQYTEGQVAYLISSIDQLAPVTDAEVERWQRVADNWFSTGGLPAEVVVAGRTIDVTTLPPPAED